MEENVFDLNGTVVTIKLIIMIFCQKE